MQAAELLERRQIFAQHFRKDANHDRDRRAAGLEVMRHPRVAQYEVAFRQTRFVTVVIEDTAAPGLQQEGIEARGLADVPARALDTASVDAQPRKLHGAEPTDAQLRVEAVLVGWRELHTAHP